MSLLDALKRVLSCGRNLPEAHLKGLDVRDLVDKQVIQEMTKYAEKVRAYYLSLDNTCISIFHNFMQLHIPMLLSMVEDRPFFVTKFDQPSQVQQVVVMSTCGSFRNLTVAFELLLDGYFLEMQSILRMVEQWLECSLIVEGNPEAAPLILEYGLEKRNPKVKKAVKVALRSSEDVKDIYERMGRTFGLLSLRAHPLKVAFNMSRVTEGVIVGSIAAEEMFAKDSKALATMAKNSLGILVRHFQTVPSDWHTRFQELKYDLLETRPVENDTSDGL